MLLCAERASAHGKCWSTGEGHCDYGGETKVFFKHTEAHARWGKAEDTDRLALTVTVPVPVDFLFHLERLR